MGIDRAGGSADESDDADREKTQYSNPEQRAEANQTGEDPSGTTGSRNDKNASMPSQETPKQGQSREHQPTGVEEAVSPLKDKPSYGADFADLKEEFDARAQSRELPRQHNAAKDRAVENETKHSRHSDKLDDESIKERIDPFAPNLDKAEGRKEPFDRVVGETNAEWTDGIDSFDDLPTGEKLTETDEDKTTADKFRKAAHGNYDKLDKRTSDLTNAIDKAFGPHPTGHSETQADSGPTVINAHHIDPGSAASAVLAAGIVGAETFKWIRDKFKERDKE